MQTILTLNAGSSSVKFAVYSVAAEPDSLLEGQVENLGPAARLVIDRPHKQETTIGTADHKVALHAILRIVRDAAPHADIAGVGHRIVHGGIEFDRPVALTTDRLERLSALIPLAPLHQPHNLSMVDASAAAFPDAVQIGCFDTAFHRGHPWVNDTFALPRQFYAEGVRRYGFHGLSYEYITSALHDRRPDLAHKRLIVAHLGNGASMCAIREGRSIGSSMGFSALDGLPMGSRCGQLDPGVLLYLLGKGMGKSEITRLLYHESGLKGLSGIGSDMRELLDSDAPEAEQAIEYYVFRIRRELGAMSAVLGGVDAIVFCGGIGENSPEIRARVIDGMHYLGLEIDPDANAKNAMSVGQGANEVLVIRTDEERVLARAVAEALLSD